MRILSLATALLLFQGCKEASRPYQPGDFSDPKPRSLIGSPLPPFSLPTPSGDSTIDSRGLAGSPSVVAVWATWCPSCLQEVETLKALKARHGAAGLRIVSLSVDESPAPVPLLVARTGMDWPVAVNGSPWFTSLGLETLPQIFFLDRRGIVVDAVTGAEFESQLVGIADSLMASDAGGGSARSRGTGSSGGDLATFASLHE